jgi:hypothetical protein
VSHCDGLASSSYNTCAILGVAIGRDEKVGEWPQNGHFPPGSACLRVENHPLTDHCLTKRDEFLGRAMHWGKPPSVRLDADAIQALSGRTVSRGGFVLVPMWHNSNTL